MGKQKRVRIERHELSLAEQMENPEEGTRKIKEGRSEKRLKSKPSKRRQEQPDSDEDAGEDAMIPKDLSGRILQTAREQQAEIDADERQKTSMGTTQTALAAAIQSLGKSGHDSDSEEELSEDNGDDWEDDWEDEMNAEDEAILAAFMTPGTDGRKQKTLSDVIFEKIREKQAQERIEIR